MENILITGGAGFIGSRLVHKLTKMGFGLTVLDSLSEQIHGKKEGQDSELYQGIKDKVAFVRGSIESKNTLRSCIKNQDAIVHLAAETGTGQSMYEIERYSNVNIGGTALLLDILANEKHMVKKVVVASSRAIYGEGKYYCENDDCDCEVYPKPRLEEDLLRGNFECKCPKCGEVPKLEPTSENSRIHPSSVYGITKQNQEDLMLLICKSLAIPCVALRYQNVYGPGQSLKNPYTGILSIFSTLIKNKKTINIFEDGNESRDFVFIDDVVDATVSAITNTTIISEAVNVGSGVRTSVLEVANKLVKLYGGDHQLEISGNFRIGDIRHNFADLTKAKRLLGYEPKWNFSDGIREFCNWVERQEIENNLFSLTIEDMKKRGLFK